MKKRTPKQWAALSCVAILVLLYVVTLVCAIFDFDGTGNLFMACLIATIALPILLWIYIWMYGKLKGKQTIASMDILGNKSQEDSTEQSHDS